MIKSISFISLIAFTLISCGKLKNKSDRGSHGDDEPIVTEQPADSADAAAADGKDEPAKPETEPKMDPAMALTGKELYAKLCASCHMELDKSDVGKTSLAKLRMAIANVPEMANLKDTAEQDLEAIQAVLSEVSPGKGKGKEAGEAAE